MIKNPRQDLSPRHTLTDSVVLPTRLPSHAVKVILKAPAPPGNDSALRCWIQNSQKWPSSVQRGRFEQTTGKYSVLSCWSWKPCLTDVASRPVGLVKLTMRSDWFLSTHTLFILTLERVHTHTHTRSLKCTTHETSCYANYRGMYSIWTCVLTPHCVCWSERLDTWGPSVMRLLQGP